MKPRTIYRQQYNRNTNTSAVPALVLIQNSKESVLNTKFKINLDIKSKIHNISGEECFVKNLQSIMIQNKNSKKERKLLKARVRYLDYKY